MEDSLTSNQSRSIGEIGTRESSGPEHVDEDIVFVMSSHDSFQLSSQK